MELTDITKEIYQGSKRLEEGSKKLFQYAKDRAETEKAYRQALATEILVLKDAGMSVTLIPDIARGKTADLKFKRDLADAMYTSARDAVEALKAQVNALQSILKYQSEV